MTQTPANQPPVPPAPPAIPGRVIVKTGADAAGATTVYTARDVAALRARGSELSRQLNSADSRRRSLQERLQGAQGADKAGLEQRLSVLDNRIARIELDIEQNGRELASLPATLATSTQEPFVFRTSSANRIAGNVTGIIIVFTIFVLSPIAFSISRLLWKRSSAPRQPAAIPSDTTERLERMEQAMDAIAIEIERVSEGQRFVTRILAEGKGNALGAGEPALEAMRVPLKDGAAIPR
jgi:hypothetical protein